MSRIASSNCRSGQHMEQLEIRRLFAAPRAVSIYADNRGEVQVTFDQPLLKATVNTRSVLVGTSGPDGIFGNIDDVKVFGRVKLINGGRRVWFKPDLQVPFPAGTAYAVALKSSRMLGANGDRIDGEWNGGGQISGNGLEGGDVLVLSKRDKSLNPTARLSTIAGNIDVRLFLDQTPQNAVNFLTYMDDGSYDNTFVQRNLPGFIWPTGGSTLTPPNAIAAVTSKTPVINEPSPTQATRGTISLARPDDGNPTTDDRGTNQFFFNLVNNESNLGSQNGGFTEFGVVTGPSGLAVMDAIAAFPTIDGDPTQNPGIFDDLAVQSPDDTITDADQDPQGTLVTIRRIALRNKGVQWVL